MISDPRMQLAMFVISILVFSGVVAFGVVPRLIHRHRRGRFVPEEMPLDQALVRHGLTDFLSRHRIVGDADIRSGVVLSTVPVERLDPLLRLFDGSFKDMLQIPNAVNGDLYIAVKKPGQGTGWDYRCSGVSVSDIGEIVRLVQRMKLNREGSHDDTGD